MVPPLKQPFMVYSSRVDITASCLLQQHMDDGRQAVGGAGGIGHHVVVRLVVLRVVYPTHLGPMKSWYH